jgi:hypothetical protein
MIDSVQHCSDFARVLALPRRDWQADAEREELVTTLSDFFRRPGAPRTLLPIQAAALEEASKYNGLICAAAVGFGKMTLVHLLPVAMELVRPVVIVPASVLEQSETDDYRELNRYWMRGNTPKPTFLSYQQLGVESGEHILDRIKPDGIICDEAQYLRNRTASVTRRVGRYLAKNPSTKFVALTGSLMRKSLQDFAHLIIWALREKAPVPLKINTLENWARALDLNRRDPLDPGALNTLPGDGTAQDKFRLRLTETPGVIATTGQSCDVPLSTRVILAPEDVRVDSLFQSLENIEDDTFDAPDDLEKAILKQAFGFGFYYKWKSPAPKAWLRARRAYNAMCREVIETSQKTDKPIDCERAFARAYAHDPVVMEWRAIRKSFEPETEAVWKTDSVLQAIEEWIGDNAPAIVVVSYTAVGYELARRTKLRYYRAKGMTEDGYKIKNADPKQSAILSLESNRVGRNLQGWCRMLIAQSPSSSERLEQMIGREHRQGQESPVEITFMAGCQAHLRSLEKAVEESEHVLRMQGQLTKILLAPPNIPATLPGIRWR